MILLRDFPGLIVLGLVVPFLVGGPVHPGESRESAWARSFADSVRAAIRSAGVKPRDESPKTSEQPESESDSSESEATDPSAPAATAEPSDPDDPEGAPEDGPALQPDFRVGDPVSARADESDDLREFRLPVRIEPIEESAPSEESEPPAPPEEPEPAPEAVDAVAEDEATEPEPTAPIEEVVEEAEAPRDGDWAVTNRAPQMLRLTAGGSVQLDLKAKIDRAEISKPEIADILVPSPNRVILVGKSAGTTQLLLQMGQQHRVFHVTVRPNYAALEELIASSARSSRVRIGTLQGQIVLTGRVPDGESARRIVELATAFQGGDVINQLTVAGVQQTLLRVTVAEVNKQSLRSLGINWAVGASNLSRDFFFANNLGQLNPTVFSSSGLANVRQGQMTFSALPNANGTNTNITFGFPRAELQFFLNALRQNSLARILAEPNLVAINGQTASFLAGGEVPIPVSQGGAVAGAITIQYKEFGVRLAFTPTVVGGEIIRLHVMAEVSEAIPEARQINSLPVFSFRTRRVESTIECGNEQTFAIAGLLNEQIQAAASKIPGIGDLPILGTLFSSVDYNKQLTELVVLVTPQLVEALDPNQVPPPSGALAKDPTDFELFMLQKLEGESTPGPATAEAEVDDESPPVSAEDVEPPTDTALEIQGPWGIEDPERVSMVE